jgi:mono/diheme cytochrome c family protein
MQDPIAPAADALFNAVVYTNGELVAAPRSDADWSRLDDRVRALASAALPLKALAPAAGSDVWMKQADLYAQAVDEARTAIAGRSVDGVLAAGGKLYASCAACHEAYMERN